MTMRSPLVLTFLVVPLLAGCSHTYFVVPGNTASLGDTLTVSVLNDRLADRSATLLTKGSMEFDAFNVVLSRDSCTFLDESRDRRIALPAKDVLTINRSEHLSGALGGMGLGLLDGFAVGGAIALS